MASPAPAPRDEDQLHELEPEQRLVAAVFRRALLDVTEQKTNELEQARARSFLAGAGSFGFFCALGHVDPHQVARRVATLTK